MHTDWEPGQWVSGGVQGFLGKSPLTWRPEALNFVGMNDPKWEIPKWTWLLIRAYTNSLRTNPVWNPRSTAYPFLGAELWAGDQEVERKKARILL